MANCTEQDVRRDAIAKAIAVFKEGSYNVTFKGNTVFVTPSLHPKSKVRNMAQAIREANRKLEVVEQWAAEKFGEKFRKGWGEVGVLPDKCQVTLRIPSKLGAAIKIQKEQDALRGYTGEFKKDISYFGEDQEQLMLQEMGYPEDLSIGTPIKEGVDFVFEQTPELINIGTKSQYSQYLNTVFPDSKVKDIVYHATNAKFEKFDKSFAGTGVGDNLSGKFMFSLDKEDYAKYFKYLISALVNIETNSFTDKGSNSGFVDVDEVGVFEPEQIHILSSKKDLEMFRNFINFTKSEYAKYGGIQQFRDYIMSKNFAAIEEFLVVNNKIDRKC